MDNPKSQSSRKPQTGTKSAHSSSSAAPQIVTPFVEQVDLNEFPEIVELHEQFRACEWKMDTNGRESSFSLLVNALWARDIFPSKISQDRPSPDGGNEREFLCTWDTASISEDPLQGWFAQDVLIENCPEVLARYLARVHIPAETNEYEVLADNGTVYGVLVTSR